MSDRKDQNLDSPPDKTSHELQICLFSTQKQLSLSLDRLLNGNFAPPLQDQLTDNNSFPPKQAIAEKENQRKHYELHCFSLVQNLVDFINEHKEQIDCIVLSNNHELEPIFSMLWKSNILLPTVIVETEESIKGLIGTQKQTNQLSQDIMAEDILYHQAEIHLYPTQLKEIPYYINLAITKFISLAPNLKHILEPIDNATDLTKTVGKSLSIQQRRLTNKIKERLGYLGVYYKRNAQDFYRNLSSENKSELLQNLSNNYRQILLDYFEEGSSINQLIDEFVDRAFFADISTSQILEIHMDLIDEFSHQLQLEGRNDDILLDYRLPLIDVTSHLCEMYRRSIPGDEISLELLFGVK